MKTRHYEFTEHEIYAIRNALIEYWHSTVKNANPKSPFAIKEFKSVRPLIEQFKNDIIKTNFHHI